MKTLFKTYTWKQTQYYKNRRFEMFKIKINEKPLKTEVSARDALYWHKRLSILFPKNVIGIIKTNNVKSVKDNV